MQVGDFTLREYQVRAIDVARERVRQGNRRVIGVSPTGSGKTIMSAALIQSALDRGFRVLFMADRRILVYQASAKLSLCGIPHSILMAGEPHRLSRVTVASRDTLFARSYQERFRKHEDEHGVIDAPVEKQEKPAADLVIVDEAHLSLGSSYLKILHSYPEAVVIGWTATPSRTDGRGLGEYWDDLFVAATYHDLIESGSLVPTQVYAPTIPDLAHVRLGSNGDYDPDELAAVMDKRNMIGDVVEWWKKLAWMNDFGYRRSVVFATSIAHSVHLRDAFRKAGIPAEHMDGDTPQVERAAILERLESGETLVVCNCQVLDTGWDQPSVSCCVLAKPTTSITGYRQMAGRVQRPFPGKDDALLIDHSGSVFVHGYPDDDDAVEWTLDAARILPAGDRVQLNEDKSVEQRKAPKIVCRICGWERIGNATCPACGAHAVRKGKEIVMRDGDLQPVDADDVRQRRRGRQLSPQEKLWRQTLARCANRGLTYNQALHLYYRESGGEMPPKSSPYYALKKDRVKPVWSLYPGFVRGRNRRKYLGEA